MTVVPSRRGALNGCKHGEAELAVNGRVGRRVACVLDIVGNRLETFDFGEEGEESEDVDEE